MKKFDKILNFLFRSVWGNIVLTCAVVCCIGIFAGCAAAAGGGAGASSCQTQSCNVSGCDVSCSSCTVNECDAQHCKGFKLDCTSCDSCVFSCTDGCLSCSQSCIGDCTKNCIYDCSKDCNDNCGVSCKQTESCVKPVHKYEVRLTLNYWNGGEFLGSTTETGTAEEQNGEAPTSVKCYLKDDTYFEGKYIYNIEDSYGNTYNAIYDEEQGLYYIIINVSDWENKETSGITITHVYNYEVAVTVWDNENGYSFNVSRYNYPTDFTAYMPCVRL